MESDYDYWWWKPQVKLNTLNLDSYYMRIEHLIAY